MKIELEITDPEGVHNRGGRLETGARISLDQHDGRAKAWLRFGQAKVVAAAKAEPADEAVAAEAPVAETPAPDAAPQEEKPKPKRQRGGKKRGE